MFLNMRVIFRLVENRKNNNMKMDLSHADMLKGAQQCGSVRCRIIRLALHFR